jgi:hypothetical protein
MFESTLWEYLVQPIPDTFTTPSQPDEPCREPLLREIRGIALASIVRSCLQQSVTSVKKCTLLGKRSTTRCDASLRLPFSATKLVVRWQERANLDPLRRRRRLRGSLDLTAIDRDTKLLIRIHIGCGTAENANLFADTLASVSDHLRPHVSIDGFNQYQTTVCRAFSRKVDHSMLIRQFGSRSKLEKCRHSPTSIIGAKEYCDLDYSEPGRICTNHTERNNRIMRMQNHRCTPSTNAASKK